MAESLLGKRQQAIPEMDRSRRLMTEFVLGEGLMEQAVAGNITFTSDATLNKMVLLTEEYDKITVRADKFRDLAETPTFLHRVTGFKFGSVDLSGGFWEDKKKLDLGPHAPFLKGLTLQHTTYQDHASPDLWWLAINYLRCEGEDGQVIEIGARLEPKSYTLRDGTEFAAGEPEIVYAGRRAVAFPAEEVKTPCMIVGVGKHKFLPMCLQVIAIPLTVSPEAVLHLCVHGKSDVGLCSAEPPPTWLPDDHEENTPDCEYKVEPHSLSLERHVMEAKFVCLEADKPLHLLNELWNSIRYWAFDRSSVNNLQAGMFTLLDRVISQRDTNTALAILRLDRHLVHRIQTRSTAPPFHNDRGNRLKLRRIFRALSMTMSRCQKILMSKPDLNCYCVAFLAGEEKFNIVTAVVTALCQASLLCMLVLSAISYESKDFFVLKETIFLAPLITAFACMLVYKQISNSFAFCEAFPEFATHPLGYLDRMFNRWLGVAVVIVNFFLLITCDNRLDFVLNSTAAFFIIELDDGAVFLDADGITDLYRRLLQKELRTNLKEIDDELYFKEGWEGGSRRLHVLDEDACEVVFS